MDNFYYAMIGPKIIEEETIDNICIGVMSLSGEVNRPDYIRLETCDYSLLGKQYNAETGEFADVE